jgi:hypothetical protein
MKKIFPSIYLIKMITKESQADPSKSFYDIFGEPYPEFKKQNGSNNLDSGIDFNTNNYNSTIDPEELKSKINYQDLIEYAIKIVKKTVKCEDTLIKQIMYAGLSSYIQSDPINLAILAPTSEGKTYAVEECLKLFPKQDVLMIGSMSTKALIRKKGILVDSNNQPIEERLKQIREVKKSKKKQTRTR